MFKNYLVRNKNFKFITTIKSVIDTTHSRIHGHYRYDGFNYIKYDENSLKSIISRENETFKYWKKYLDPDFKKWNHDVYARQQLPFDEEGEKFGNYIYSSNQTSEGSDILVRRQLNDVNTEVVFDLKTVPFVKDVNSSVLKTLRISPDHKRVNIIDY